MKHLSCAILSVLCSLAAPAWGDPDEERAAWRYRREAVGSGDARQSAFAVLPLPPEMLGRCQDELRDLRLVLPDGQGEVPYAVDRQVVRLGLQQHAGQLSDARRDRDRISMWEVDLGAVHAFDTVLLEVPEVDFAKRVTLEAAGTGGAAGAGPFKLLRADAGLFDMAYRQPGGEHARHTLIVLAEPVVARFLRLTVDDHRSDPIHVTAVSVQQRRLFPEQRWVRALEPRLAQGAPGKHGKVVSSYRLAFPAHLPASAPIEELELNADDPVFRRQVTLYEEPAAGGERKKLGSTVVYRLRPPGVAADSAEDTGEQRLLVPEARPGGGALVLEIEDGDSPALHNLRVSGSGVATRLLLPLTGLPAGPARLQVYYGNAHTRAPSYDLGALGEHPPRDLLLLELGAERENPRYRPSPPLTYVATLGAKLEMDRWRKQRPLQVPQPEDLYGVVLPVADLGVLQRDLRDLRIVDDEGRQVPYVLSRAELGRAQNLELRGEPAPRSGVSRYRLEAPGPLPLWGVDLQIGEPFFSRRARLFGVPAMGSSSGKPPELYSGPLSRAEAEEGEGQGAESPLRLPLNGEPVAALSLEIDEGDNRPLTVRAAQGVVLVPRLSFKAKPGSYRMLLGNADAEAPSYDIETLRRRVLEYAAIPLVPGEQADNPAYRRRAADYLRGGGEGHATELLWGAIGVVAVLLLLLTAKLVKPLPGPDQRPPDEAPPA